MRPTAAAITAAMSGLFSAACSGEPASPRGSSPAATTSASAQALLADLRLRFVLAPAPPLPERPSAAPRPLAAEERALLRPSQAERWEQADGWLVPRIADHHRRGLSRPARVRLPLRASGAFELRDDSSGMKLVVRRLGASEAGAEQADGWAVFRGGLAAGGDVLHRATAEGTEDFVHLAAKPEREELRYRVGVSAVAGLRLVSNVLEFVNAEGDPRLRMTAPALVDGAGERRELRIAVEGCAYSSDPAPPWGRPVVEPGASECEVVVSWQPGASYPLLIDPSWTTSGNLAKTRFRHTASVLLDGTVLVVGGNFLDGAGPQVLKTSEVWNNGSFAASGSMGTSRGGHTANVLPDGRVLVIGGSSDGGVAVETSEVWSNGTFAPSSSMAQKRNYHTATSLPDGRVLVIGGAGVPTSEVWSNGIFSASGSLIQERTVHTATPLPDGRVLIMGGNSPTGSSGYAETIEVWNEGSFSPSGEMVHPRSRHTASLLPDGRVFVTGGQGMINATVSGLLNTSELWDKGASVATGSMAEPRTSHTSTSLPDGRLLVVGGVLGGGKGAKTSELWTSGVFAAPSPTTELHIDHTASLLPDGRVLVIGGQNTTLAEVWSPDQLQAGQPCVEGPGCSSGFCVDGVCCDDACADVCRSCLASKTGKPDGVCAPVAAGTDPDSECDVSGTGPCATQGVCDGKGACQTHAGEACGEPKCLNDSTQQNAPVCGDDGVCAPSGSSSCAPYKCKGSGCATTCTGSDDCLGSPCIDGKCGAPQQNGKQCADASQCKSGFCVDGLCCDTACDQPCFNCVGVNTTAGKDGTCSPTLAEKDPRNECPEGKEPCLEDGLCNGEGQCRPKAKQGAPCGTKACEGDSLTHKECDGFGSCEKRTEALCPPFACDVVANACKTKCNSNADCSTGATCAANGQCTVAGGSCADAVTAKGPDGTLTDCRPYTCLNGQCRDACAKSSECADGFACVEQTCQKQGAGGSAGASGQGGSGGQGGSSGNGGTSGSSASGAGGSSASGQGGAGAGGAGAGGAGAGGASAPAPAEASDDGGCGCRAAGSSQPGPLPAALLAVAAAAARRRRRSA